MKISLSRLLCVHSSNFANLLKDYTVGNKGITFPLNKSSLVKQMLLKTILEVRSVLDNQVKKKYINF